ncbi:MAG: DUF559 domain-containing protein [Nanoarchaeota archaeon]|nr:DUF559 domain-containing protein [Nanoarchaeota archaeon]
MKKWTEKEVEFLKKKYLKLSYREMALELKRNKKSIEGKLNNLRLKKSIKLSKSEILKTYYKNNDHHTKGKPKSEEQRRKLSIARKKYLERTNPEVLQKIYRKMSLTKRRTGVHLGEKNSMFGKKRPDLVKRNKESWKDRNFRIKIKKILQKTTYQGSQRQKNLYKFLKKRFPTDTILFNDWKTLDYKYEIDISIPTKKIAIEWDGYRWHYGELSDNKRDSQKNQAILDRGWKFIRIKDDHLNKSEILETQDLIIDLINNINSPDFKITGGFYIN